jgi:hypothetical protein
MKKRKVKLVLVRTVVHQGKHHWPDSVVEWDEDIAMDLIERGAAEPCADVVPAWEGKAANAEAAEDETFAPGPGQEE